MICNISENLLLALIFHYWSFKMPNAFGLVIKMFPWYCEGSNVVVGRTNKLRTISRLACVWHWYSTVAMCLRAPNFIFTNYLLLCMCNGGYFAIKIQQLYHIPVDMQTIEGNFLGHHIQCIHTTPLLHNSFDIC